MTEATRRTVLATMVSAALMSVVLPSVGGAQPRAPIVIGAGAHGQSPPLSVLAQLAEAPPARPEPLEVLPAPLPVEPGSGAPAEPDPVVQNFPGAPLATTDSSTDPDDFPNFDGIAQTGSAPPDTNGAIGATQYMQFANSKVAVYDKATGALLLGPVGGSTLFAGMGLPCESNRGDGVVLYDRIDGRWMFSQLVSRADGSGRIDPFSVCIAVSATSDATGSYYQYLFDLSDVDPPGITLNDYPKFGAFPAAYFYTANSFGSPSGTTFCAFDRVNMVQGNDATAQCFFVSGIGSYLPGDFDGRNLPADGSTGFLVDINGADALRLFAFHVDFDNPDNTTLTDPPTVIPVGPFSRASGGIAQPGTSTRLDNLGDRLMFRLAYRNLGDHESLVVNHSVNVDGAFGRTTGLRWYEVRDPGGNPFVFQQGTYAPDDGLFRWMGSIAMDQAGDIAVGYSVSSDDLYPSVRYTGRTPADPPGILGAENSIVEGTGFSSISRWGDYSALTVDPVDDCTFWFTTEYHQNDGSFNWNTRIGSFRFSACGGSDSPGSVAPRLLYR